MKFTAWNKIVAMSGAAAMLIGVAACGGSNSSGSSSNGTTQITVWAWEPTLKAVTKKFEAKYPNIKVNLQNVGTNTKQYTALNNAIAAGKGAPDVAQIEY